MAWYKRQEEHPASPEPNPAEAHSSHLPAPETTAGSAARDESRIGGKLRIKGELDGRENLRVDGQMEGRVSLGGNRMTVGEGARVSGPIEAGEIVVHGTVSGNLRAADRIEIGATGVLQGDVATASLRIAEGAQVHGRIQAGPEQELEKRRARQARREKSALPPMGDAEIPASDQ
jgi:cytoskeletal protein CcmA (bactofilin family)